MFTFKPFVATSSAMRRTRQCVLSCGIAFLVSVGTHAGELQVAAANANGNSVYDLTQSSAGLITGTSPLNDDGAAHGAFESLVWLPNAATQTLDLIVADPRKQQIVKYAGPKYGNSSTIYRWGGLGKGPAQPQGLTVDTTGNLYVLSSSCDFDGAPSLWVFPVNKQGVYGAPILIDHSFGWIKTSTLAETLIAGTTTKLFQAGDLVVLVGDLSDARVIVYSQAAIAGVLATGKALSGPTSTAVPWSKFAPLWAVPIGMDLWPADATHGPSLLITTTDGRILRFDTAADTFAANFASGLGKGLSKIKAGASGGTPYAFVAQQTGSSQGRILQFGAPPPSGQNPPLAIVTKGVNEPSGLAVTGTSSSPSSACVAPDVCSFLGGGLTLQISGPGAKNVSGNVLEQSCVVQSDPRVTFPNNVWTCNGAETLNVANYCPGFPETLLPGSLCGHSGASGAGFVVIKGTADGVDPVDNDAFITAQSNINVLLPGPLNQNCSPLAAYAWAPRPDLPGIEGTIVEDALLPYFIELTGFCDEPGVIQRGASMTAFGVALNTSASGLPGGLPAYVDAKYTNLQSTIRSSSIAATVAATLDTYVTTSETDFNDGVAGAPNGFACAAYWAAYADTYLRNNLPGFSSNLTAAGGNPDPAGEIDGRLANLYIAINSRVAGNPPNPAWPATNIPACVTLTATPAKVASGTAAALSWSAFGVTGSCSLSASDGAFATARIEGTTGAGVSTGNLTKTPTYTAELSCPGSGGASGFDTVSVAVTGAAAAATVTLSASPNPIVRGGASTLTWSSTNATSCTASNGWSGTKATSGTLAVSPAAATTYALTCAGAGAGATASATVTVYAAPTLVFSGQTTIDSGGSTPLTWSATVPSGAGACTASSSPLDANFRGSESLVGSAMVSPTVTTTYTLTCVEYAPGTTTALTGGSIAEHQTVTVQQAVPTVTLTANPTAVNPGSNSTLTWSSTNATSCTASNGWNGTEPTSGMLSVSPTAATTYTLTCIAAGGANATASATVSIIGTILSFNESPANVTLGNAALLNWNTVGFTSCELGGSYPTTSVGTSASLYETNALTTAGIQSIELACSPPNTTSSLNINVVQPYAFSSPNAIAVGNGVVYVANAQSAQVLSYVYGAAGSNGEYTQLPLQTLSAGLTNPVGLAVAGGGSTVGDVFVLDAGNNSIPPSVVVFNASGSGVASISLPNGSSPAGIAVDGTGNLYVAVNTDSGGEILVYSNPTTNPVQVATWLGDNTGAGSTLQNYAAVGTLTLSLDGLHVLAGVSYSGEDSQIVTYPIGAAATPGLLDANALLPAGLTIGGTGGLPQGGLPTGVAIDLVAGTIYASVPSSTQPVVAFDSSGNFIDLQLATGSGGQTPTPAQSNQPGGVAVIDFPNGNTPTAPGNIFLFLSDTQNSTVNVYEAMGAPTQPQATTSFPAPFQYTLIPVGAASAAWVGTWDGSVVSTCGYLSGPFDITITSLGGNELQVQDNYGDTYDLFISSSNPDQAQTSDGTVTYAISGNSMTAAEPNSCQTSTLTKQ